MPSIDRATLDIQNLNVHYGQAHALQDVSLSLSTGVLAVVGRNGMGKSTLCKALTGLVPASGSAIFSNTQLLGLTPDQITHLGIGYVPQGRRVWRSLTVDETLQLAAKSARKGAWNIERVYGVFPRLAERRNNGGAQLSGGEQQMLAIGRALLFNPRLLVMDEPTEGLAPVIVEQVASLLRQLAADGDISILLVEQNLGVALEVADRVAVMMNGRIATVLSPDELASNKALQQRYLGVGSGEAASVETDAPVAGAGTAAVFRLVRSSESIDKSVPVRAFSSAGDAASAPQQPSGARLPERDESRFEQARHARSIRKKTSASASAYVVGTFDTRSEELDHLRRTLSRQGVSVVTVDLSAAGPSGEPVTHTADAVARYHPQGPAAVFDAPDKQAAAHEMGIAFERFIHAQRDIGGILAAGGAAGSRVAITGMRGLPLGTPKVIVSSMPLIKVQSLMDSSDICLINAVCELNGLNRLSQQVLENAAQAMAGMVRNPARLPAEKKPLIGMSVMSETSEGGRHLGARLASACELMAFPESASASASLESLAAGGELAAIIDLTTTALASAAVGIPGARGGSRLDRIASLGIPYVGSCGGLDLIDLSTTPALPEKFRSRHAESGLSGGSYVRTSADEARTIGHLLAEKLNAMSGPVQFLLPVGGLSASDAPGKPGWDPEADEALFCAIEQGFKTSERKMLKRVPFHINSKEFASAAAEALGWVCGDALGVGSYKVG